MLEAVRHLDGEAVILLGWVQGENEALRIVPLWVLSIAPFHELVLVKSDFAAGHKACLANLLSNLEISANYETVLGQNELEGGRSVLAFNLWIL